MRTTRGRRLHAGLLTLGLVLLLGPLTAGPARAGSCAALGGGPLDGDLDGYLAPPDCDDSNPDVWLFPGEVFEIRFDDPVTMNWLPVPDPGASSAKYTVLRSTDPADFSGPLTECLDPLGLDTQTIDPDLPASGEVFFYLVRAVNDCAEGPLGTDWLGVPRVGKSCDCGFLCDDGDICTLDSCFDGSCLNDVIPPRVVQPPRSVADCVGGESHFYVLAEGLGGLNYQWYKNGVPVGLNSPELILSGIAAGDDGAAIWCEVTDGCATTPSQPAILSVLGDPASCQGGNEGLEAPNGAGQAPGLRSMAQGIGGAEPDPTVRRFKNVGAVQLHSGEYAVEPTSLTFNGRGIDLNWEMKYRSRVPTESALGVGWDFSYNIYLEAAGPNLELHDGNTRTDTYYPSGTPGCWVAQGFFRELCMQADTSYRLTFADTLVWKLHPLDGSAREGKIAAIVDRNGNTIVFDYDAAGRLYLIVDTLGRPYQIAYDANGFIESFTDFMGRQVRYEHYLTGDLGGTYGDLKSITTPAVIGTSTGNDFPAGKTILFTYTQDRLDPALDHNLLTITDGAGQTYLENVYTSTTFPSSPRYDRLDRQIFPDGVMNYVYIPQLPSPANNWAVTKTVVNDRVGNVSEHFFDVENRLVLEREFTGRAQPTLPTDDVVNLPMGPLRPTDPAWWETRYEYNSDYLITRILLPEGNEALYDYDSLNPDVRLRSNLLFATFNPGPRGGSPASIVHSWIYAPGFGTVMETEPDVNLNYTPDEMCKVLGFRVEIDNAGTGSDPDSAWETCSGGALNIEVADGGGAGDKRPRPGHGFTDAVPSDAPKPSLWERLRRLARSRALRARLQAWIFHTDGRGNTYNRTIDANGNVTSLTRPTVTIGVLGGGTQTITESWVYDGYGRVTQHTLPSGRIDELVYYTSGCQDGYLWRWIADAPNLALTTTFDRDCLGRVTRLVDPRGHDTLFEHNALDQVVRVTSREVQDFSGIRYETDLYYDAADNLFRIERQNIDDQGIPAPNTHLSEVAERDTLDRVVRLTREATDGDCVVTGHEWDANDNPALLLHGEAMNGSDPANVVRQLFDERDLLYRAIRAEGHPAVSTTQYDYDGNANLVVLRAGLEDPAGPHRDLWTLDGYDRPVMRKDAEGNLTYAEYDANHNRTALRREGELIEGVSGTLDLLYEADYVYDEVDRMVGSVVGFFDPPSGAPLTDGSSVTKFFYNEQSQPIRIEDDNSWGILVTHDTADRVESVTDDKLNASYYGYDENSNVISIVDVDKSDLGGPDEIFVTSRAYDNLDRLTEVTDNLGNQQRYRHDSLDHPTWREDALGNVTNYSYDGLDRRIRTEYEITDTGDGSGTLVDTIVTTIDWDDSSRVAQRTDDNGNVSTYSYDPLNRLVQSTLADGSAHAFGYDVHDNPTDGVDANGTIRTAAYDGLNRLTERIITPGPGVLGTTHEQVLYDGMSRVVHAEDDDSAVDIAWDSLANPMWEQITSGSGLTTMVLAEHDGVGNATQISYPSGRTLTLTYDKLNRVKSALDGGGPIAGFHYIGPYRVERADYRNGTRTEWFYDPLRRPVGIVHSEVATSLVLDRRDYDWDPMHNKTREVDVLAGLTTDYDYDSVYRLVQSVRGASTIDYALDGAGNRSVVSGGPDPGAYTMDPTLPYPADAQVNQYTSTPFDSRLYDANGNTVFLDDGVTQLVLSYDFRNQLVEVADMTSAIVHNYSYDPLGRRIESSVGPTPDVARYAYDGLRVLEEQDALGNPLVTFVHGTGVDDLLTMTEEVDLNGNGTLDEYTVHRDELGSVTAMTNAAAAVVERYAYADFGLPEFMDSGWTPIPGSAIGNKYLFTGRRYDPESGFYHFRTRAYDPRAGRFLQREPVSMWLDPLARGNAYVYVGNNPATWTDPSGWNGDESWLGGLLRGAYNAGYRLLMGEDSFGGADPLPPGTTDEVLTGVAESVAHTLTATGPGPTMKLMVDEGATSIKSQYDDLGRQGIDPKDVGNPYQDAWDKIMTPPPPPPEDDGVSHHPVALLLAVALALGTGLWLRSRRRTEQGT